MRGWRQRCEDCFLCNKCTREVCGAVEADVCVHSEALCRDCCMEWHSDQEGDE